MDQLRQVLNRVDIMVRRRAYKSHSRGAVTDPGNGFIHLPTGKFASFAGRGPVGDLDLELIGIGEIPDGDPESS